MRKFHRVAGVLMHLILSTSESNLSTTPVLRTLSQIYLDNTRRVESSGASCRLAFRTVRQTTQIGIQQEEYTECLVLNKVIRVKLIYILHTNFSQSQSKNASTSILMTIHPTFQSAKSDTT